MTMEYIGANLPIQHVREIEAMARQTGGTKSGVLRAIVRDALAEQKLTGLVPDDTVEPLEVSTNKRR